jgi:outer membrane protein insertion porin family
LIELDRAARAFARAILFMDGIGDLMTPIVSRGTLAAKFSRSVALAALFVAMGGTAAIAQAVVVQGNRRVDSDTIRSYFAAGNAQQARQEMLSSGLFSDVRVSSRGGQTVVSVVENDTINRVAFEGNSRLKGDLLVGEVQSKARGPISQNLIDADVQRIKEIYRRAGYGLSSVTGRIAPLPNGRSDVVFTIVEGSKTGVQSITFIGNNAYSNYRLKGLMNTTEANFMSWLKTSDVYDPDKISSDLELVRRFYLKNGYADFRIISNEARFDDARGGWIVDIAIEEGDRYAVGNVRVDSRLRDVDSDQLQRIVTTSAGDTYNAEAVERSLQNITTEVMRRGYAFAQVRPRGERDSAGRTIGITYVVDEGPRVYVERINVRGNNRTRDYVVRRELDMGEGDPYNKVLLDRAERRLNNLGFFNKVRVTNEPGSAPDRVVVNIEVEDKATGSFAISGGYSTSDGIIGEVSLTESNFLGRGQYVKIAGTFGQRTKGIDFSFTEPYFLGQRMAAGIDLFSKFSDNTTTSRFQSRVTGGQLRLTLPITEEFSVTPRYSLYQTNIKIPNTVSKPYDDCSAGNSGLQSLGLGYRLADCLANGEASVAVKEAKGNTITSLFGVTMVYNALDNTANPRNGFYAELKPDVAGLGGDSQFLRIAGDARYYREIFEDFVGVARVQGGHIMGFSGSTRMTDHFFMGPSLVRGFAVSGMGPRDVRPGVDTKTSALGGTTYFGGSLEVQFPIFGLPREIGLKGAVFADAGTLFGYDGGQGVFDATCPSGSSGRLFSKVAVQPGSPQTNVACVRDQNVIRSSVGASILWASPLGPIRFDYAFALTKDKGIQDAATGLRYGGDRTQAFRFSGGARF